MGPHRMRKCKILGGMEVGTEAHSFAFIPHPTRSIPHSICKSGRYFLSHKEQESFAWFPFSVQSQLSCAGSWWGQRLQVIRLMAGDLPMAFKVIGHELVRALMNVWRVAPAASLFTLKHFPCKVVCCSRRQVHCSTCCEVYSFMRGL